MNKIKKYKEQMYWVIIVLSLGYSIYAKDLNFALSGFLFGGLIMEIVSRVTYYLIKNKSEKEVVEDKEVVQQEENIVEPEKVEESQQENIPVEEKTADNIDMNVYVKKNKRAFDEGDTYLAAASGALVGYELFMPVLFFAIILQALFILPQFLINLYKKEEYKLFASISAFILFSLVYFLCLNTIEFHIYVRLAFAIILAMLAFYSIFKIKNVKNPKYKAIPFGPSLFFVTLIIVFFGKNIIPIIKSLIG